MNTDLSPQDLLILYVHGELNDQEAEAFEKQLAQSPELQAELAELTSVDAFLNEAFEAAPVEPVEKLDAERKAEVFKSLHHRQGKKSRVRFFWKVSLPLAASFVAAVLVVQEIHNPERYQSFGGKEQVISEVMVQEGLTVCMETESLEEIPMDMECSDSIELSAPSEIKVNSSTLKTNSLYSVRSTAGRQQKLSMAPQLSAAPAAQIDEMLALNLATAEDTNEDESYKKLEETPFREVTNEPLSTFSIDVDTASYSNIRRMLNDGRLPPKDAVRIEEMLNYFRYDYRKPEGEDPFSVNMEEMVCPWNRQHKLVRVGLNTEPILAEDRPAANLVFLLDVSGSMSSPNKLPLLKQSFTKLLHELNDTDKVSIVVYAGASGKIVDGVPCSQRDTIERALDNLRAGGSTNGGAGLRLAYQTAVAHFIEGGINRVILATDGDFNVGQSSQAELEHLITKNAKSGVFLSVLGFGMGNLKDDTMELLANKGNGHYAYIDTLKEAEKVLVKQLGSTLMTVAKDVKIQVEFNPLHVESYRLIGYENRRLNQADFRNDKKDAGEVGAGHQVTALYELVPHGVKVDRADVPELKYAQLAKEAEEKRFKDIRSQLTEADYDNLVQQAELGQLAGELLTLKLRWKKPDADKAVEREFTLPMQRTREIRLGSADARFAAGVATFGLLLTDSAYKSAADWSMALDLVESATNDDEERVELIKLIKTARRLKAIE